MHQRDLPDVGGSTERTGALPDEAAGAVEVDSAQHAQDLLAEHVPLTLLVDLLSPTGETSAELLDDEGLPENEWWTPPADGEPRGA